MSLQNKPIVSQFNSIQSFQTYFQDQDELLVPANQSLEIKNISILTDQEDNPFEANEVLPQEISQLALYLLCKMALPLAKTVKIRFDDRGQFDVHIDQNFSLSHSMGMTIKTQKDPICTRLGDLFKLMIAFSIPKIEFTPHQELNVLGITEAESQLEPTVESTFLKFLDPRVPAGFQATVQFKGQGNSANCQISNGWVTYGGCAAQRSFTIRSLHGWALTLYESNNFLFSANGFYIRMKIKDEWKIPPNQVLRIEDESFAGLQEEYSQAQFASRNFVEFALNKILLPLGKTIKSIEHGKQGLYLKWDTDFLELSSPDGFTLKTVFGDLGTTLTELGRLLIMNHISSLVLQPNQRLFIYGINEAQKTELEKCVESNDKETIMTGLAGLLIPYNPIGFVWNLEWNNDLYVSSATWEKFGLAYGFMISSSEGVKLKLNRVSGEWLALNLINHSSPALLESILDADEKAFIYILFKALFYYCCGDFRHFRSDELPEFFKKTTQSKLVALKNNADFTEALRLVIEDFKTQQQFAKILGSSPEELSQLNLEKLPAPLKTLMKTLMNLVWEELQGSPFIAQGVRIIWQGLANGTLKNLIKPIPENVSVVIHSGESISNAGIASNASNNTDSQTAPIEQARENPTLENANSSQSVSQHTETSTATENRIASSPQTEVSTDNPSTTKPTPITPPPSMFSNFLSFVWSTILSVSRFVARILGM
jgi:hypothetical protein